MSKPLATDEGNLQTANINLGYTDIVAPIDAKGRMNEVTPPGRAHCSTGASTAGFTLILFVQKLPRLAVEPHFAQFLDRLVVSRAGVQGHPREQPGHRDIVKVRRLAHDILAR